MRSLWEALFLVALVGSVACTKRNPEACCTTQEDCDGVGLPLGSDCADGLTCIFNKCTLATCETGGDCPAEAPECSATGMCVECIDRSQCGDQVCSAEGKCVACSADEDCGDGFCVEGSCRTSIVPRYLPDVCDTTATGDLVASSFNTTSEATTCSEIVPQDGGPDICVVRASSISIPSGMTVSIRGEKAIAFVADRDLAVEGTLDVSANLDNSGPGGGLVVSGAAPTSSTGGGGAGSGGAGGPGGSTSDGGAANGGQPIDPTLAPTFQGGTRSAGISNLGHGGGGGALLLISCRGTVRVSGLIDAAGGGGLGGAATGATVTVGGFGGGSGGNIVLQAFGIEITGQVFANGGGGGAGPFLSNNAPNRRGQPGENGSRSATVAAAGGSVGPGVGGGAGGIGGMPAKSGSGGVPASGTSSGVGPSGGGGGVGFLQTYLPSGRSPDLSSATASPPFSANRNVLTQ